jgi:hypothetical protein
MRRRERAGTLWGRIAFREDRPTDLAPGRTDQWGVAPPKADRVKDAQLAILFARAAAVAERYRFGCVQPQTLQPSCTRRPHRAFRRGK